MGVMHEVMDGGGDDFTCKADAWAWPAMQAVRFMIAHGVRIDKLGVRRYFNHGE